MKKLIFLSFIIFISFFTINSQTVSSLGITGTYYDIRADNNGNIHILWIDNGWAKYGQIVNRQVVNQVTINVVDWNEVNYRKVRPRLSVKPDGSEVHFVWVTPFFKSKDFIHCWRDSGGTWRREKIVTVKNFCLAPTFTVDSSGVYHAVVIEDTGGSLLHPVAYWRKAPGGGWIKKTNLAPATKEHLWPNLFTDMNGNVHITWDEDKDIIKYRYAASGGDLSTSATMTLSNLHPHNKQSEIFADASGNVYVAALSYYTPGTQGGIDYWVKPVGGSFSTSVRISGPDFPLKEYFPFPAVIARSPDMVAVSWAQTKYLTQPAAIGVAVYDGAWQPVEYLSTTANFKADTRTTMAMNDETAFMVWREGDQMLYLATFDYALFGVLSPNGGENWSINRTYEIRWNLENATGNVNINLYKNSVNLGPVASDVADAGSFNWTINTLESGASIETGVDYQIEVRAVNDSDSDMSSAFFTIDYAFEITSPVSSSAWEIGQNYNITWTSPAISSPTVKLNIYKDSILVENFVEQLTGPNSGSYSWTIPSSYVAGNYIIRLKTEDGLLIDDSDLFSITGTSTLPSITVTSPTSSDTWDKESTYDITWEKTGTQSANVKINVFRNSIDVANFVEQLTGPNSGSYSWTIPGTYATGNYILRLKTDDGLLSDDSDVFAISGGGSTTPSLTITSPTSSDTWDKGSTYNITWERNGTLSANIKINVYKDSILAGNFIEQLTGPNSGTYSWTIPGTYTAGNYILRMKTDDNLVTDDSDVFVIAENSTTPSITITSPTSSDTWDKGSTYNITWDRNGTLSANIKINVYKDSILVENFIEQLTGPNSGTYSWTIPGTYTAGNYILRMKTDDNLVSDDSDVFQITDGGSVTPTMTIISPSSCSSWPRNNTYTITWLKDGTMSANVIVNIYKDSIDVGNFVEQLAGPNTGSMIWAIPSYYEAGNYIIRLKTDDDQVSDDSDLFAVNSSIVSTPKITVTSPTSCDTWSKLKTYKIAWSKAGTMSDNVKINIYKDSIETPNFVQQLTGPNTGSIDWTIPGAYVNGNYILRIKTVDSAVIGDSNVFVVTN